MGQTQADVKVAVAAASLAEAHAQDEPSRSDVLLHQMFLVGLLLCIFCGVSSFTMLSGPVAARAEAPTAVKAAGQRISSYLGRHAGMLNELKAQAGSTEQAIRRVKSGPQPQVPVNELHENPFDALRADAE